MLVIVITLSFFLMPLAPGSPFQNARKLPSEIERNINVNYGMDQSSPGARSYEV